jgi:hypothetical protein
MQDALCYSIPEACLKLGGISRSSLYRLLRAGEIGSFEIRSRRMIDARSLVRYVDRALASSSGGGQDDCR